MSKTPSKNSLCPCGSKKKYKRCCGGDKGTAAQTKSPATVSPKGPSSFSRISLLLVPILVLGGIAFLFKDTLFSSTSRNQPAAFSPAEARSSHTSMVNALKVIGESAQAWHPYLGDSQLQQLRQFEQQSATTATPKQLCDLHFLAGLQEGQLGNLRAAIDELKLAYDLLPKANFEDGKTQFIKFKLGVAYLRLGETENCCITGGPESCILPIGPEGIHNKTEGSENAIRYFMEVLESGGESAFQRENANANSAPEIKTSQAAKWLLNVAHMTLGSYPDGVPEAYRIPSQVFQRDSSIPKFTNIAEQLELDTFDLCGGVICDDFDNDGLLDIITSTWDPQGQLNFFRNQGDGSFSNRTDEAGLTGIFGGLNINQADFNNDGFLDLFVTRGAWTQSSGQIPNSLIRNNGDGTFTDISFVAGIAGTGLDYPTQVAQWSDFDADGDLDLFVGNEHTDGLINAPCQLFQNNGDETFTDVAAKAGVTNNRFTKGASFGDFDNDGDSDLYLSNLREPNRLYRNNGDGTFTDVAEKLKVTSPNASFPTWFFDYDNDGNLDLFVAGYTGNIDNLVSFYEGKETDHEPSCLYKGDGRGGFVNVTEQAGLTVPMLPMGANFGDLNNDGFLDFYLGTGDPNYESLTPNMMFLNVEGEQFRDITMSGGFGHLQKGHGVAFADLDNDGDSEVFEQMGGAFLGDRFGNILFENPGFDHNWIALRLVGTDSNRSAIGARIEVKLNNGQSPRTIWRTVNSGGSFGANPLRQTIGLGRAELVDQVIIHWPKPGKIQTLDNIQINQFYEVTQDNPAPTPLSLSPFPLGK